MRTLLVYVLGVAAFVAVPCFFIYLVWSYAASAMP